MMEQNVERSKIAWYLKYAITFACGACIVLALVSLRGVFSETNTARVWRLMCDGCFLAGVLLTCLGLMTLVSKEGLFDIAAFGFMCFMSLFKKENGKRASFYDYKQSKKGKRSTRWNLVFVGAAFLAAALVCNFAFEACAV